MSTGPKTRTRVKAGAIARARKPSGRLNKEDFKNAGRALKTGPNDSLAKRKAIKAFGIEELDMSRKSKEIKRRYLKSVGLTTAQIRDALSPYQKTKFKLSPGLNTKLKRRAGVAVHHPKKRKK